jgi:glycine reductase
VVLLGTPTADSSKVFAMTVTEGDPSWAGALAGVSLGLPTFHITEAEIKAQVDAEVYGSEVEMVELVLEAEEIAEVLGQVRRKSAAV